jgi:hypothetical protein
MPFINTIRGHHNQGINDEVQHESDLSVDQNVITQAVPLFV